MTHGRPFRPRVSPAVASMVLLRRDREEPGKALVRDHLAGRVRDYLADRPDPVLFFFISDPDSGVRYEFTRSASGTPASTG